MSELSTISSNVDLTKHRLVELGVWAAHLVGELHGYRVEGDIELGRGFYLYFG